MGFGVFMHRADSIYDDSPSERYQFPKQYLGRVSPTEGHWIIYLEPTKVPNSRGYFAVARVEKIIPDPTKIGMYLALIEPGTYLDFTQTVPFSGRGGPIERGLLNDAGSLSGRAQAAVRSLSNEDFNRIVVAGLPDEEGFLPRRDEDEELGDEVREIPMPFEYERPIVQTLVSKKKRAQLFRRGILNAYDNQCAVTGWKLINGGGRAEAEAAHIKPVERNGNDSIQNGIALSGTVHWMFDRGLISLSDEYDILVSRQVNDRQNVDRIINPTGKALVPSRIAHRPHPSYLRWHRDHCFKA